MMFTHILELNFCKGCGVYHNGGEKTVTKVRNLTFVSISPISSVNFYKLLIYLGFIFFIYSIRVIHLTFLYYFCMLGSLNFNKMLKILDIIFILVALKKFY